MRQRTAQRAGARGVGVVLVVLLLLVSLLLLLLLSGCFPPGSDAWEAEGVVAGHEPEAPLGGPA